MRILVASPIDSNAIVELEKKHQVVTAFHAGTDRLCTLVQDCQVLVFRSGVDISAKVMACAPHLGLLVRAGSGIDNLDIEYVRRHELKLVRIPGPGARAVAEMSFALMLALSRNLFEADRLTRRGRWAKHELTGYLLADKVLGIVGTGNIGSRVGQIGVAWGMEVVGCVEHPSPARAVKLSEQGIRLADLQEVVSIADYVSVHVPLKDSTRSLISADVLGQMKPGSYLINLARGGVVDEHDLHEALTKKGGLGGAALDVHQEEGEGKISPLAELPNVILTPHIGAMTVDTQREIGRRVIQTIDAFVPS